KPQRIVYVSCNPSSLARDIDVLSKFYKVDYIQPVDMFPHTAHVECVAKLALKL
ncbi:MAG: 23S rRNA (uracil-5-)-methyltransferase RumA, partial [Parageobacillus thermoglucosidasius]|nr:23S rRNA (uracil-5-)-methyltransferase RumA [Parageobacillus thermoglucosidasius]